MCDRHSTWFGSEHRMWHRYIMQDFLVLFCVMRRVYTFAASRSTVGESEPTNWLPTYCIWCQKWEMSVCSLPHPSTSRLQINGPIGRTTLSRFFVMKCQFRLSTADYPYQSNGVASQPLSQVFITTTQQYTGLGSHFWHQPDPGWLM